MEPKMKFFYPRVKAVDGENRSITVCISKDEIDRHRERIEISAIADALKGYAANPVVLGDHQHRLSTGKSSVIGHTPPESFKVIESEVDMDIVFSVTENAESYWINYRDGHQKAVSIGFIDLEWRFEEQGNEKIYVITKLELLELSCVAVPANRGALIKTKGMFDKEADIDPAAQAKDIRGKELTELPGKLDELIEMHNSVLEGIEDIKSLLIADPDGLAKGWLGSSFESPNPAGDRNIAEQSFDRMKHALNFGDKDNANK